MHFTIPDLRPTRAPDPSAMARAVVRSDVIWNRPVFKAPPLELLFSAFDATIFAEEFRRITRGER